MKMHLKIMLMKFQKKTLAMNKKIKNEQKKSNLHGKLGDISAKLNFTDTQIDPSDGYVTDHLSKHPIFDDYMASFDKTTVYFLQTINFHRNLLKFFLGCIPSFYDRISVTKNKIDETPSNPIWEFLTSVLFKTLITKYQYIFPLGNMAKKRYGIQYRRKQFINFMLAILHILL